MRISPTKLVKFDKSNKILKIEISTNDEKEVKELYVEDAKLMDIIGEFVSIESVEYEEGDPHPILKSVKGKISFIIYGAHKGLREKLRKYGELKSYLPQTLQGYSPSDFPAIGSVDDPLGFIIVVILVILFPLILAALYYLLIVPLLIMVLTVFTLGEAFYMMWRKVLVIDFDTGSEESIRNLEEIALNVGLSKGAIEKLPRQYLPKNLTEYLEKLLRIHKLFWRGIVIQTIAIIIFAVILAVNRYLSPVPKEIYFQIEIVLAIFFLVGFSISMLAGYLRRFTEVPHSIKFDVIV